MSLYYTLVHHLLKVFSTCATCYLSLLHYETYKYSDAESNRVSYSCVQNMRVIIYTLWLHAKWICFHQSRNLITRELKILFPVLETKTYNSFQESTLEFAFILVYRDGLLVERKDKKKKIQKKKNKNKNKTDKPCSPSWLSCCCRCLTLE